MRFSGLALVPLLTFWQCGAPHAPPPVPEIDGGPAIAEDASLETEAAVAVIDASPEAAPDTAAPDAGDSGATAATDAGVERKCKQRVLGQSARRAACTRDDHCTLRPAGCCPKCGPLEASEVRAVDTGDDVLCTLGCPQCASGIPANLRGECVKRRCVVVETVCEGRPPSSCPVVRPERVLPRVLEKKLAACVSDRQCMLRVESCCHCGVASGKDVVAVRRGTQLDCKGSKQCPDCLSAGIDASFVPVCVEGLCRVKDRGLDPLCSGGLGALMQ